MTELPREDVRTFPRPPALEPVPHRVAIMLAGVLIVDTRQALRVLETYHAPTYYIPRACTQAELRPARGRSVCEWKGVARYFDVIVGDTIAPRAAWTYDRPTARFAQLAGHLSFYAGTLDAAWIGETCVEPQPGDFYGGWVTPNLEGPIKGAIGTRHW